MKARSLRLIPVAIVVGVFVAVWCGQREPHLAAFCGSLEGLLYDWRVRLSTDALPVAPDRLGAVTIDDEALADIRVRTGSVWPIPRRMLGQAVDYLTAEGAQVIGSDILLAEELADYSGDTNAPHTSDEAFAESLRRSSNVVLAAWGARGQAGLEFPAPLFGTHALAVGHVLGTEESDAVLRRVPAWVDDPRRGRVWSLGVVMAAEAMGLDLAQADLRPEQGVVLLRDRAGIEQRRIPIDSRTNLLITWAFRPADPRVPTAGLSNVLSRAQFLAEREQQRRTGWYIPREWNRRVVLIYSTASGNNFSDVGATPFGGRDYHGIALLNVVNSILTGCFVHACPAWLESLIVGFMVLLAAALSWRVRALWSSLGVALLGAAYCGVGVWLYRCYQFWLPYVWPLLGALLTTHLLMVAYRLIVERTEAPVRAAFGNIVSANIIDVLLRQTQRSFSGSRRVVTMMFADLRGFTQVADRAHRGALQAIERGGLTEGAAEAEIDRAARVTLDTVNDYLNVVADVVKAHDGTLDKYIGDCLTAFWGAPVVREDHAIRCVQAALAAREAVARLNAARQRENELRRSRRPDGGDGEGGGLPVLEVGIGIHTGPVLVGFMGAQRHLWNYSIFGREVIIASRMERLAGHDGHAPVLLSEPAVAELRRHHPALAKRCRVLGPVELKGIQEPLVIYELE